MRSGSGGVGTSSEASCVDQPLDALGLRALVHAIQARHASRSASSSRDRLVGGDHQVLDQAVGLGLRARADLDDVAALVEVELRLARESTASAPRCSRARCSAAAASRAAASGSAHGSARALGAGEDAVDALVVEALVGADQRAVERGAARRSAPSQLELDRHRQALAPGHQRARVVRQRRAAASARRRPARTRSSRARAPRRRPASPPARTR